jgi:hypothetical protein
MKDCLALENPPELFGILNECVEKMLCQEHVFFNYANGVPKEGTKITIGFDRQLGDEESLCKNGA